MMTLAWLTSVSTSDYFRDGHVIEAVQYESILRFLLEILGSDRAHNLLIVKLELPEASMWEV